MPHFTVLGLPLVHACCQAFCFGICVPPCSFLCGMNHVFMKNNSLITAPHLLFRQRLSVLLKRNTFLKDAIHSPTRKFMISAFASLAGALEADPDRHQQKCLDVVIIVTSHGETEQPHLLPEPWAVPCRAKAAPNPTILWEERSSSRQFVCFRECHGNLFLYTVTNASCIGQTGRG